MARRRLPDEARLALLALLALAAILAILSLVSLPAPAQQPAKAPAKPARLEAVAETKLLMDALAEPNFKGLEKHFQQPPADADAWSYARGQALLLAETGNLLLLRPPRSQGQDAWNQYATELRETSTALARQAAARDYDRSRLALRDVAGVCSRCHQTFRVPVKVGEGPGG